MNPSNNSPRGDVGLDKENPSDFDVKIKEGPKDIYLGGGAPKRVIHWQAIILTILAAILALICAVMLVSGNAYADEEDDSGNTDNSNISCINSGGAVSLGWVVCPTLEWLGGASEDVYNRFVKPSLQIEPKLFSGKQDEGVMKGWGTFRDIANALFIILFLFVIFSQLTGVGIDNYGIKKILPKMVVAAILINLSYWVCLLLVDLSNIVGNGFQAMFDNLGSGLGKNIELNIPGSNIGEDSEVNKNLQEAGMTTISAVVILAALVGMVGAVWANPAILLSLLVAALGVAISIFFLFILLTVRQAAVVVLTVLSPVAVVCYMLPNTKSLLDKWWKMFSALLLLFPICGLLIGGGNYISKLLLSSGIADDGFLQALMAMIVGIVPVFFIPTLLKNSFSAMGNVGAKISSIGQNIGKASTGAAKGAGAYKALQESGRRRQVRIRAGVDKQGNAKDLGRFGILRRGGRANVAANRSQYLQDRSAAYREANLLGDAGMKAAALAQDKGVESQEVANYTMLINDATRNGADEGELLRQYDNYMESGNKSAAIAAVRIAGRRKDTASRFLDQSLLSENSNRYNISLLRSVAKEMSEGEAAGNFRSANPVGFEYVSQMNVGGTSGPYRTWAAESQNISNAMNHHITNSKELVGVQRGNLEQIANLMESGGMSSAEATRLQNLAQETIANRGSTGVWDTTKEAEIYRIANYASARNDGVGGGAAAQGAVRVVGGGPQAPGGAAGAGRAAGAAGAGGARPNANEREFDVRGEIRRRGG